MRLTIATEEGATFNVDVDSSMELNDFAALLEAESGISTTDQLLFFSGKQLTDPKASLASSGVAADDLLLLRQRSTAGSSGQSNPNASRDPNADVEAIRRRLLGDPQQLAALKREQPELAAAAESDPTRFAALLAQFLTRQEVLRQQQQASQNDLYNSDPYDVEAQRRIEEAIRMEAVDENYASANENNPESFGSVHMLYVNTEVNGVPVKAFVDSGAQMTIMSPGCAERTGVMRLLDTRFAGMARGVGTAKILGRVHSAQLKMGADLFLQCSFSIMEGKDVELLLGLDMLKRHQAVIDLAKDALVIQGREIRFLSEHELPKNFHEEELELDIHGNPIPAKLPTAASSSISNPAPASSASASTTNFPGAGSSLASAPAPTPTTQPAPASSTTHSQELVDSIMNLGVGKEEAVRLLDMTGGNADMAASLLFSGGAD